MAHQADQFFTVLHSYYKRNYIHIEWGGEQEYLDALKASDPDARNWNKYAHEVMEKVIHPTHILSVDYTHTFIQMQKYWPMHLRHSAVAQPAVPTLSTASQHFACTGTGTGSGSGLGSGPAGSSATRRAQGWLEGGTGELLKGPSCEGDGHSTLLAGKPIYTYTFMSIINSAVTARAHSSADVGAKSVDGRVGGARTG